ncbi:hypothetical protein C8Q76DRAFT_708154 [Earliella scabrosa]|nr:hypothetical protein C8Q76DRAFT_708154 [Earliella scabrosa]
MRASVRHARHSSPEPASLPAGEGSDSVTLMVCCARTCSPPLVISAGCRDIGRVTAFVNREPREARSDS